MIDPGTAILIQSAIGALGGLLGGGGGQDRQSFSDSPDTDPRNILDAGLRQTGATQEMIEDMIGRGVSLPGAYAQPLPTFTGGGLPMPIGTFAMDPALTDPYNHLFLEPPSMNRGAMGTGREAIPTLSEQPWYLQEVRNSLNAGQDANRQFVTPPVTEAGSGVRQRMPANFNSRAGGFDLMGGGGNDAEEARMALEMLQNG